MDIILNAIAEETDLTIGDYTVTPIEDIVIENLDEDVGCPFEIDDCNVCGGSGYNTTGCCGNDIPDCTGACGGSNMSCNGNCFDNTDNDCAGYENPDTCTLNDHCHWAEVYDDGGVIYAYCHYEGPPECVWDCENLCDWVGDEGQSEPSEEDPIAFCEWVLDTVNGDDGAPECLDSCEDIDYWEEEGPGGDPDGFCGWVNTVMNDPCSYDCEYDEQADMIAAYEQACSMCVNETDGCAEAMNALDGVYDNDDNGED